MVRWWGCCLGLALLSVGTACPKNPTSTTPEVPASPPGGTAGTEPPPAGAEPASQPSEVASRTPPATGGDAAAGTPAGGQTPEVVGPAAADAGEAFEDAIEKLNSGPDGYASAMRELEQAISLNPRLAEAHFNKGVIHQRRGELSDAERSYRKAIDIKPTLAEAWVNLASIPRQQREFAKALDILNEGLKSAPQNALLLNNRALVLRQMGRTEEAIDDVRKILKINAIDVNAFNNLGRIYIGQDDYEMARLVFEKALQTVPAAKDDPYIHHNLGVAYLGLKDPRARDEFEAALALEPNLVPALVDRAYLHLEVQEYDKAAELLRRAVAVAPQNVTARLNLGVALRGLGELDRAELQYEEALKLEPRNPAVLMNYGVLLGDYKKDYLRALDVYKRLKDAASGDAEVARADKLIKEAQNNYEREQKRKERERLREEEKRKQAEEAAKNPPPEGEAGGNGEAGGGTAAPVEPGNKAEGAGASSEGSGGGGATAPAPTEGNPR